LFTEYSLIDVTSTQNFTSGKINCFLQFLQSRTAIRFSKTKVNQESGIYRWSLRVSRKNIKFFCSQQKYNNKKVSARVTSKTGFQLTSGISLLWRLLATVYY
jgi:hypothetical protein